MPFIAVAVLPDILQIVPLSMSCVATDLAAIYVDATGSLSQAQCEQAASRSTHKRNVHEKRNRTCTRDRQTPAIREFAQLMIKDHTAANESALALVKKLGVTPKDNPFSQTLVKNGEAKKAELRGLTGAAFDRAYAQNELAYHQIVVKTVADQWIPSIQNAEFKMFMTGANDIFRVHLSHAQHVVDGLK
jgi:predicted outer membrane protein